jgi:hypothetical protein
VKKQTRGIRSPRFSGQDSVGGEAAIASGPGKSVAGAGIEIMGAHHRVGVIDAGVSLLGGLIFVETAAAQEQRAHENRRQKV